MTARTYKFTYINVRKANAAVLHWNIYYLQGCVRK